MPKIPIHHKEDRPYRNLKVDRRAGRSLLKALKQGKGFLVGGTLLKNARKAYHEKCFRLQAPIYKLIIQRTKRSAAGEFFLQPV